MEPLVLDVRDDLRRGVEPFPKIMAAIERLAPGQSLVLIAPFEPRPLYHVLAAQGFRHEAEEIEERHWRVKFFRIQAKDPSTARP